MKHDNPDKTQENHSVIASRISPGTLLAERFRLIRHLDHGGLGEVWLAEDTALENELVACKLLREDVQGDAQAIAELKREVLMTRRLRHPNILGIYTFWDDGDEAFISMEYVAGKDLGDALHSRSRPYAPQGVVRWFRQLASVLDYAHAEGVLHRDVKPGNILLDEREHIRLGDFGIARTVSELRARKHTGATAGTVLYMSPEQLTGENIGPASDQYNLAVTIYELLAGTPPFHRGSVISQIQLRTPDAIETLSPALNQVLLRGLSKNPDERFARCSDFFEAFSEALSDGASGAHKATTEAAPVSPGHDAETEIIPPQRVTTLYLRLGTILVEDGVLSETQLEAALTEQRKHGHRIGRTLVDMGFVDAVAIARGLARQLHVPFSDLESETGDPNLLGALTPGYAEERTCVPLRREQGIIVVAMADPLDLSTINDLESLLGARIAMIIATEAAIADCLARSG